MNTVTLLLMFAVSMTYLLLLDDFNYAALTFDY
jgi:hypothetical protein